MPPASTDNNVSIGGTLAYSLIVSTETTFPLIIPVLIVIDLLSLAKLSRTLIASSKFLENKSAFGPLEFS